MTTTTGYATNFINFSRASLATVTDSDGKVKWAAHNLLLASESFDSSSWTKGANAVVTANVAASPAGPTTADRAAITGTTGAVYQGVSLIAGVTYKIVIWAKSYGGSNQTFRLYADSNQFSSDFTATSTWQMFEFSFTSAAGGTKNCGIINDAALANYDILIWGAHLYRSDLGGMVANTSAYPMYNPSRPRNLLGYTEDFSNAAWIKVRSTVSTNTMIAPNGLQTADTVTEDTTASTTHYVRQAVTTGAGPHVYSVHVKAKERSWINLFVSTLTGVNAYFDLTNGVTGTVGANCTATITSAGNGWYRCAIYFTSSAASQNCDLQIATANGTASYTGDGTSGVYLWGAQLSDSASLDPYISNPFAAPTAGAYHGPRLDYDPATLAAKGLLVEQQSTNQLTYSNTFDNAAWGKMTGGTGANPVVTANAATAPDGTNTAYKVVFDKGSGTTTTDQSTIVQSYTTTSITTHSLWVKADSPTKVSLKNPENSGTYTEFNVTTSWQRITITASTTPAVSSQFGIGLRGSYSTINSCTVYIWGAQLEIGSFATSYIPTTSATVTRSADVASVATSAFPYSGTEGTLVINWRQGAVSTNASAFVSEFVGSIRSPQQTFGIRYYGQNGGNVQLAASAVANTTYKAATAYTLNQPEIACLNGGTIQTNSVNYTTPATVLTMGYSASSSNFWLNGWIRQITYIPRRLSDAELQARTA